VGLKIEILRHGLPWRKALPPPSFNRFLIRLEIEKGNPVRPMPQKGAEKPLFLIHFCHDARTPSFFKTLHIIPGTWMNESESWVLGFKVQGSKVKRL
jgi:hypothetical protein